MNLNVLKQFYKENTIHLSIWLSFNPSINLSIYLFLYISITSNCSSIHIISVTALLWPPSMEAWSSFVQSSNTTYNNKTRYRYEHCANICSTCIFTCTIDHCDWYRFLILIFLLMCILLLFCNVSYHNLIMWYHMLITWYVNILVHWYNHQQ